MKYACILLFIIFFSLFSRLYNIAWGAPYFFHPDERNIATSVNQLSSKTSMHPHFFAYGSLPIYSIYVVGLTSNALRLTHEVEPYTVSFDQAVIISRIFSVIFSLLTIFLLFIIGKSIHSEKAGLLSAFFAATSIGLIQYAHFGTFEMWITFFSLLLSYLAMKYMHDQKKRDLLCIGAVLGTLISIKISSFVLFFPLFFIFFYIHMQQKISVMKRTGYFLLRFVFISLFSLLIFFITNPFIILDTPEFLGSIMYETHVATGKIPVFYTQGFIQTTPGMYQFLYVYPFLLNNFFAFFALPFLLYILYLTFKNRNISYRIYFLFFATLFFSQIFLFVKWTRYMIPTIPYIYLFFAIGYLSLLQQTHAGIRKKILLIGGVLLGIYSCILSGYFLILVYRHDSRLDAYDWAKKNIPSTSSILSEVYDLGIMPFNATFNNIFLGNFYELEQDIALKTILDTQIEKSEYIILPSQRIIKSRTLHPDIYPKSSPFYANLDNKEVYKKVYETPCNIVCEMIYNFDPVFNTEETATVFDRPIVQIYKKL